VLRLNMLKTHYRSPMDWTLKGLEESSRNLLEWHHLAVSLNRGVLENLSALPRRPLFPPIEAALLDDLNTPLAIAEIHKLRNGIVHGVATDPTAFTDALRFLGLYRDNYSLVSELTSETKAEVESKIRARAVARARKDFKESDRIRDELIAMGVMLKDGKDPATGEPTTTWEIAR
jgi:cysteinyl-tRNA synthetase